MDRLVSASASAATTRRQYEQPRLRPLDRSRWRLLVGVRAAVDVLALGAALVLATGTRFGAVAIRAQDAYGRQLWLWLILWWGSLALAGVYERHRTDDAFAELRHVVNGVTLGTAVAITGSFVVDFALSRIWVSLVWILGLALVVAGRTLVRTGIRVARAHGHLRRRAVVIGADEHGVALARAVAKAPGEGVDIVGLVSVEDRPPRRLEYPVLGSVDALRDVVVGCQATEVILAASVATTGRFSDVIASLDGLPVELRIEPGVDGFLASRLSIHPLGDRALVGVERIELRASARLVKRVFDLVLGIPACLVALPIIAVAALVVRIDSRGPAFFRQTRVGVGGREFKVWKLRTMVADAEEKRVELLSRNEGAGLLFKIKEDPRVTRVGRMLRRTSLDELPQLFNVIVGQMSLVGPRPPLPEEVARYDAPLHRRLLLKPGITGLWQVSGRSDASFEDYVRFDVVYVQSWSVALDVLTLLKTLPAVLRGRGAC